MFSFIKKGRRVVLDESSSEEIKLENNNIDLKKQYIYDILQDKKLPIVLLDPLWHIMRESIQSEIIKSSEKELKELLKEQGRLNNDQKEYGIVKQNFLKEILNLSDRVQNESDSALIEELNKLHESTLGVNEKLESIEIRLEEVEKEIQVSNKELIEEMIAIGYEYIDEAKFRQSNLDSEIVNLREQMLMKTNEKKSCEKSIKDIYNYLHSIIGVKQIEEIDRKLGDKK